MTLEQLQNDQKLYTESYNKLTQQVHQVNENLSQLRGILSYLEQKIKEAKDDAGVQNN